MAKSDRRVAQGEATRQALLQAARATFGSQGYAATSLDEVVAAAGVTIAITTDHPVVPIHFLIHQATLAVKEGLDPVTALRAVKADSESLKLQNEFFEKARHPLETK